MSLPVQDKWLVIDTDSVTRGMSSRVSGHYVSSSIYHGWCDLLMDLLPTTLPTHAVIVQGTAIRPEESIEQCFIAEATEPFGITTLSNESTDSAHLVSSIVSSTCGSKTFTLEIVTSDIRCWQLISEHVVVVEPFDPNIPLKRITEKSVRDKFGIEPRQLPDFLALVGHPPMDVPGLKGIGKMSAAKILSRGRSLTQVLSDPSDLPPKFHSEISKHGDDLLRWRNRLALNDDSKCDRPESNYHRRDPDFGLLRLLLQTVGSHRRLPVLRAWCNRQEPAKQSISQRSLQHRPWAGQGMLWLGDDDLKNRTSRTEYDGRYNDHLKSARWGAKCHAVMKRDNYVCRVCEKAKATQVHHKSYDRFGHEPLIDLIAVCGDCHQQLPTSPDGNPLEFLHGTPLPKEDTIEYWMFLKRILNKWRARSHPATIESWRSMEARLKELDSTIENAPDDQQASMLAEINTLRCEIAEVRALGGGIGSRGRKSEDDTPRMKLEEYWQPLEL